MASPPKLRVLCLHGFRTSAAIFKKQITFLDGPYPALGKSEAEGIFQEPYFEWYQANKGGVLAAAFAGLQQKGLALHPPPPLCFLILVAGAGFNNQQLMHECYSEPVKCPSVHIIGAQDSFKKANEELVLKFENPLVIRHEGGHIVPKLGEEPTKLLRDCLLQVQSTPAVEKVETSICK